MNGGLEFKSCAACYDRGIPPGGANLCDGCRHNRAVISALLQATEPKLNGARARALTIFATEAGR